MLDFLQLQQQFSGFGAYQVQTLAADRGRLQRALEAYHACDSAWESLAERVQEARGQTLAAAPLGRLGAHADAGTRPTPLTLVATDGSQIYPDRHVEPACFLLNISRIAFHYGTTERPLIEAVPYFRYRDDDLGDLAGAELESATVEVISALRDELELKQLFETAQAVRQAGRIVVAMADGTLIRWMVRNIGNRDLEARLIAAYTRTLAAFREARIPVCSYISMPGSTEVVNLLRLFLGEADDAPEDERLAGLTDRKLFERLLRPGQRSALYESSSKIQREYGADRICAFYVHAATGGRSAEIGRVETPRWVADDPALVDLVHAVVVSECDKGGGYPLVLSEAHERAVVRAGERAVFYDMVGRAMNRERLPEAGSRKAAAKRAPRI